MVTTKELIVTIAGIQFKRFARGVYVRFGEQRNVMISQQDVHDWEIYIHEGADENVVGQKAFPTKEGCVHWAISKGFIARPAA